MKHLKTLYTLICATALIFSSCGNGSSEGQSSAESKTTNQPKPSTIPQEFTGSYHGIQPGYFLKNKNGSDMVINGNKVPVPSIDYTFTLNSNSSVSLQQINLDDNSKVNYEGTVKILTDNSNTLEIECSLSDGSTSKPTYTLTINKSNKTVICRGNNEPDFQLKYE